jgi:hypothetical protein
MNTGVNNAYQFISEEMNAQNQRDLILVMYGENDNWNAFALQFYLQSQCMRHQPDCRIIVTGEREMNRGWPPRDLPPETREEQTNKILASADQMVIFAKEPLAPSGWVPKTIQKFDMARYKVKPTTIQVLVLDKE